MKNYTKYLEYIENVGQPCTPEMFDEDWEPIGPTVRDEMVKLHLIEIEGGFITIII